MIRFNPDDPKWTAYILGELDETERAAVEAELNSSAEARALVDELRLGAELFKTELHSGAAVAPLTVQQRKAIVAASHSQRSRRWFKARPAIWTTGLAAASLAAIVWTLTVQPVLRRPQSAVRPSAVAEAKPPEGASVSADRSIPEPALEPEARRERALKPAAPSAERVTGKEQEARSDSIPVDTISQKKGDTAQIAGAAVPAPAAAPSPTVNASAAAVAGTARGGGIAAGVVAEAADARVELQEQKNQQAQQGQRQLDQARINPQTASDSAASASFDVSSAPAASKGLDPARLNLKKTATLSNSTNDNPFLPVAQNPRSSFPVDVGTASYADVREYLNRNRLPPRDVVRIEEMVNNFTYDYPQPEGNNLVGATIEAGSAPWNPQHRLVRIGIKPRDGGTGPESQRAARRLRVQVEFSAAGADAYRLIGYENGLLRSQDLKDGVSDVVDVRSGRSVTALYEVVPSLKSVSNEMLKVTIGYQDVASAEDKSLVFPFVDHGQTFAGSSADFRFATAVASFGMILRNSPYKGTATIDSVLRIVQDSLGADRNGARREFLGLVRRARQIRER